MLEPRITALSSETVAALAWGAGTGGEWRQDGASEQGKVSILLLAQQARALRALQAPPLSSS